MEIQVQMVAWCSEYDVPAEIVLGCIERESQFDRYAMSKDCVGYMQINVRNLGWLNKEIGVTDLYDPAQNIHAGTFMLGNLYEKYGDWHMALVCYNYGEFGAQQNVFSKGYTGTAYSHGVLENAERWRELVAE